MPELEIKEHLLPHVDSSRKINPTAIVLHWWGQWEGMPTEDQGIKTLSDVLETREMSVQYGVLANGDIYQLTATPNTWARHAKDANNSAIGIEIEGKGAEDLDSNPAQYLSVVALTRYLKKQYAIADTFRVEDSPEGPRFFGVTSHKQVDPYCANANGKDDVHDEYLRRVIEDTVQ